MSHTEVKDIEGIIPTTIEPAFAKPFIALMGTLRDTGTIDSSGNRLHRVQAKHPCDQVEAGTVDVVFYVRS